MRSKKLLLLAIAVLFFLTIANFLAYAPTTFRIKGTGDGFTSTSTKDGVKTTKVGCDRANENECEVTATIN